MISCANGVLYIPFTISMHTVASKAYFPLEKPSIHWKTNPMSVVNVAFRVRGRPRQFCRLFPRFVQDEAKR